MSSPKMLMGRKCAVHLMINDLPEYEYRVMEEIKSGPIL